MAQRQASPNTVAGYRDAFRLLLGYAAHRLNKNPCELDIADLDAPLIGAFQDHLQRDGGNSARTRNHRLAAIHSLFAYAGAAPPEHAASIQRVLAIPTKRVERNLVTFLTEEEADALLASCDRNRWTGRRDHALLLLTIQTGLRISELARLTCADVTPASAPTSTASARAAKSTERPGCRPRSLLCVWLAERDGAPFEPLFPTTTGKPLSRDAIERRIGLHVSTATEGCPSLATKRVTAHTLRHTCATRLLDAAIDLAVIALWPGHEQVSTTTCTLTCPRRNARSPAPPRRPPRPVATRPPTPS